jgi:hypothetical protein
MFVEGVRLFIVVLGTAAGFWAARDLGFASEGVAGMLGCLLGYVGGGVLGRLLDRALGAVERKAEALSPARVVAGSLGALCGAAIAMVLVLPVAILLPDSPEFITAFLAIQLLGAIAVPVNTALSAAEQRLIVDDCTARLAIVDAGLCSTLLTDASDSLRRRLKHLLIVSQECDTQLPEIQGLACSLFSAAAFNNSQIHAR